MTSKPRSSKRRSYLSENRMTLMGFRKLASLPQSSIKKLPIFDRSLATFMFEDVNGLKEINECADTEAATREMFSKQNFLKFFSQYSHVTPVLESLSSSCRHEGYAREILPGEFLSIIKFRLANSSPHPPTNVFST